MATIKLTDTLTISKIREEFWLYDYTRGMNLSMRAKTERDAFVEALTYYQKRCKKIEEKNKNLVSSINNFIKHLPDDDDIYIPCDCDEY